VRRPPCPQAHAGRVLLDGHIRSPGGRFDRPRYRCLPDVGNPHVFTEPLPIRHDLGTPDEDECLSCGRHFGRNDGRRTPTRFGYAIYDIAEILIRLSRGENFREVASAVRKRLGRKATRGAIKGRISDSASPATHALDIFGPVLADWQIRTTWPRIVALDALPLRTRHRKKRGPKVPWPQSAKKRKRKPPPGRIVEIGRVLVASGSDRPIGEEDMMPLLFRFEGGGDEGAWIEFLRSFEGEPEWVVSDRDKAIVNAVAEVWPQATHYFSHWHLAENAKEALKRDKGLKPKVRAQLEAHLVPELFSSLRRYHAAAADALAAGAHELIGWLNAAHGLHRQMDKLRIGRKGYPKSAGAAEAHIRAIKAAIFERRHGFTNVDRLNVLLGLIRARLAGLDDYDTAARLLQGWLEARGGRVEADWKAPMDAWTVRSLDLVIAEAEERRKTTQSRRQAPAKSARYRRNQVAYEARRRELGLPPSPRGIPRPIKAKGSVAGKTVADFPWLTQEWHPTKNAPLTPADVPAGSGDHLWWKCPRAADHEWEAQVRSRTIRGVRCPFCTHRKLARSESFLITHPDIAAEWHPTRNGLNRPEHYTFGSHHEAWWQCPTYKTHIYQARISSRTSMKSGCARCAAMKRRKKKPRRLAQSQTAA
jgi:hypothetical protein